MPDPCFSAGDLAMRLAMIREPLAVVKDRRRQSIGVAVEPSDPNSRSADWRERYEILGALAPIYPEWLGDRRFNEAHGCRFPYIVGEMARGLATARMVVAAARAGFLGFFGAAGLAPDVVARALAEIKRELSECSRWGVNLIHSPNEPAVERALVDLYLAEGVRRVSASAFMALTPEVVRFAYRGLATDSRGNVQRRNCVFAKISRPEVAAQFMSPAPDTIVRELVREGRLTATEADIARYVPVATDVTAEADSGGHTDNRPLSVLLPLILRERDRTRGLSRGLPPIRVGAAGGLGTPAAVAAAFSLGAAYVLTGTINQTAVESGLSERARNMLLNTGMADVTMHRQRTCLNWALRFRYCEKDHCIHNGPAGYTTCIVPINLSPQSATTSSGPWNRKSSGAASPMSKMMSATTSKSAIQTNGSVRRAIRITIWR
jgi:NAD(P)H-dependent flavin oxidoreductase YrpB (nitropropane dioxygenase family)